MSTSIARWSPIPVQRGRKRALVMCIFGVAKTPSIWCLPVACVAGPGSPVRALITSAMLIVRRSLDRGPVVRFSLASMKSKTLSPASVHIFSSLYRCRRKSALGHLLSPDAQKYHRCWENTVMSRRFDLRHGW